MDGVSIDPAQNHFGQWGYMIIWAVFFLLFLLFTPTTSMPEHQ